MVNINKINILDENIKNLTKEYSKNETINDFIKNNPKVNKNFKILKGLIFDKIHEGNNIFQDNIFSFSLENYFKNLNQNMKIFVMIKLKNYYIKKRIYINKLKIEINRIDEKIYEYLKFKINKSTIYKHNLQMVRYKNKVYDKLLNLQANNLIKCSNKSIDNFCLNILKYWREEYFPSIKFPEDLENIPNKELKENKLLNKINNLNNLINEKKEINSKLKRLIQIFSFLINDTTKEKIKDCKSKGEIFIFNYLNKKIVDREIFYFIDEKTFPDLRNYGNLRYDFFGIIKNSKNEYISFIIEFDGKQHWTGFGDYDRIYFNRNDIIKDFYAWQNGINILRISYDCKNICCVIDNFLKNIKKSKNTLYELSNKKLYEEKYFFIKGHYSIK